jgi:signal transduction histidine kinase
MAELCLTRRFGICGPILLLSVVTFCAVAAPPKRVLILDSFGRDVAPFSAVVSSFRTTLAREMGEQVDVYEQSLETGRLTDPGFEQPSAVFLERRFARQPLDLIVSIGSPASKFAMQRKRRPFADAPILCVGADRRIVPPESLRTNATLITQNVEVPGIIEDILRLKPHTTNIVVVLGTSPLEKFWEGECRREWQPFAKRVGFTWLNTLSLKQIAERVRTLPPHSFILFIMLVMDADGVPYDQEEPLKVLHAAAGAPIFGYFRSQLGLGAIGGRLYEDRRLGSEAAQTAIRILRGEMAGSIPPKAFGYAKPAYDWRELKRWGVGQERLPADSVIEFREPTFWEQYRWQIVGAIVLCCLQTALIIGLIVSTLARKRADAALRMSEERFRSIAVNLPGVVYQFYARDSGQRGMYYVDGRVEELCGLSVEPLATFFERFAACVAEEYRARWLASIQDCVRLLRPWESDYRFIKPTGEAVYLQGTAQPQRLRNEVVFNGFLRDITELRRSESERQRHHEELAHVNRVSALGELAGSLAHELNQPLMAILSNAQAASRFLIHERVDLDEVRDIVKDIAEESRRAGEIIQRMRGMLKKGQMRTELVNLNEMIPQVLGIMRNDMIVRNVAIRTELAPGLPLVCGDGVQLMQVLLNLIANACDAMSGKPLPDRRLAITTGQDGGNAVEVSVSDRGIGIPPERLELVFEPFFSTKPQGVGMGLRICRSIITAHGGRLWAENNASAGATFHFKLPVASSEQSSIPAGSTAAA